MFYFKKFKLLVAICAVYLLFVLCGQSQSFVTNGLVAYYSFSGSVSDSSGNENDATAMNVTFCQDRFGNSSNALSFDGIDSFILVTNFFANYADYPITESIWFCPSITLNVTNDCILLMGATGDPNNLGYNQAISTSGSQVNPGQGGPYNGLSAFTYCNDYPDTRFMPVAKQTIFQANTWSQVVGVFTATNILIYLNGKLQAQQNLPEPPPSAKNLVIGAQKWDSGIRWGFQGSLDDVRVYNRALSTKEVNQLYAIESANPNVNLTFAVKPSFSNLIIGTNYQLQISGSLSGTFTNYGAAFTATSDTMVYPEYWDVSNWNQLFFRVIATP